MALIKMENMENFLNIFQALNTRVVSSKPNLPYKSTNLEWQSAKKAYII